MSIADNLKHIKEELPGHITLVAVTKTKPLTTILEAYNTGHLDFGENRIQEMVDKYKDLPKDIKWHMIGHLQRNKVKYMAPFVHLVHGVDSFKTLKEINKQARKNERSIQCLLQARIAEEETKFGLSFSEIEEILIGGQLDALEHVQVVGLMGMATFTDDMDQVKSEFHKLQDLFIKLQGKYPFIKILSTGMSGDYPLAIENGSNMVRIGSAIFGPR